MDLGLQGRTAVVTGGTRGIGAAVVARLREEGATVLAVARGAANDPPSTVSVDVTDASAPEAILAALSGTPPDILVNNAGTSFVRSLAELTDTDLRDQHDLHVVAPARLMRAFTPAMRELGWGRVVNVAAATARRPSLLDPAHAIAKAGLLALSRAYAEELSGHGVRVNAVTPGPVASEMWTAPGGMADQYAAARGYDRDVALGVQDALVPTGRMATVEEVADVIAILCSERAASVAGAAWAVDGGYVAHIV